MFPNSFSKKVFTLLIISIFSIQFSFGQSNFLPGNVITAKGDTLKGFIDYRDWDVSPKEILFKTDVESSTIQKYTPKNTVSFVVNNDKYISATVKHEISSNIVNSMSHNSNLEIKTVTSFIKVIFDGDKKLLKYKNQDIRKDNFYIEVDGKIQMLRYKQYLVREDDNISKVENTKYKGQLYVYLSDYPKVSRKLKSVKYKENSLINLFDDYYKATSQDIVFKSKKNKTKLEYGISVGVQNTTLMFSGNDNSFLVNTDYSKSTNFIGGLSLNIILPKKLSKLSIYNELFYTSYVVEGESSSDTRLYESKIGSQAIMINNLLRYSFPVSSGYIFINSGISSAITIIDTNELDSTYLVGSNSAEKKEAIDDPRQLEFGFVFGIGAKYHKYACEIRYIRGNGMSPYSTIGSRTNKYSLLVSYQL